MNRRTLTESLLASAALLASAPVFKSPARAAENRLDPTAFVNEFAQKGIIDILAAKVPHAEQTQRFRVLFKEYFDLPSIGRFILGRFARTVQPNEQQTFDTLFEDVIVYTWSRRFSEYNGQSLKVSSFMSDGSDGAIVKSSVVDKNGENIAVDWRLRKRPDGYRAVDVIVAGVSMAITYRQEYTTVIAQDGGVAALLTQLEKQVADLKRQQPA